MDDDSIEVAPSLRENGAEVAVNNATETRKCDECGEDFEIHNLWEQDTCNNCLLVQSSNEEESNNKPNNASENNISNDTEVVPSTVSESNNEHDTDNEASVTPAVVYELRYCKCPLIEQCKWKHPTTGVKLSVTNLFTCKKCPNPISQVPHHVLLFIS